MGCRPGCGACCIAPSISSFVPGMPNGKPAGVRCIQLSEDFLCRLFGSTERPAVCGGFRAAPDTCGATRDEGMAILARLELSTLLVLKGEENAGAYPTHSRALI